METVEIVRLIFWGLVGIGVLLVVKKILPKIHAPHIPHFHLNGKTIIEIVIALVVFLSVMDWMPWKSILSLGEYKIFWAILIAIAVFFLAKKLLGGGGHGHGHGSHGGHGHGTKFASFWELVFLGILALIIWQLFCQFEKDQVVQVYDLKPGESVETIHVNFRFMLQAEESQAYQVKFTGCDEFQTYKTLKNGATVPTPSCFTPGPAVIKNPSDSTNISVKLIKVKGWSEGL